MFHGHFFTLKEVGLDELWMLCGEGKSRRFIPVHEIATAFGPDKSAALRGFHAFRCPFSLPKEKDRTSNS